MKIVVTGATGVVGRRLVPMLLGENHRVTAIVRSPERRARLERLGAIGTDVDLFDAVAVRKAITGHDVVINLATHIPHSSVQMLLPWAWRENDRLRREASGILADACGAAGVSRFIQESFAPIYPDRGKEWIDEDVPLSPVLPGVGHTLLRFDRSTCGPVGADREQEASCRVGLGATVPERSRGMAGGCRADAIGRSEEHDGCSW